MASIAQPQVIQINSVAEDPGEQSLEINAQLPEPKLAAIEAGEVSLLPGLFKDRREMTKAYLKRLSTRNLLQNHLLEAGVRIDDPTEALHQGWEATHYQLRGHFAGHWLSAASRFAEVDSDPVMDARAEEVVGELQRCQHLNGGEWVSSIPVKYFSYLEDGRPIWSPQYTVHKTLMGLLDRYRVSGDKDALQVLENAAKWFEDWTESMIAQGKGKAIYGGECAGMLELWADLLAETGDERYLRLASRYAMPDLFRRLLGGEDALSNDHANASIPWIQGAARLYEVTGEDRYRQIVETFWNVGVEDRGMFATTGNNAGEFWIPPHQFGRFLGSRTQEHCTVYNMVRVADYLFRWTGESRYADYIERALYNGYLAQQNPSTGMIAYFLPLEPGAKKVWGTETHDFWCCHGTLVQAHASYEDLAFYQTEEGVTVGQFIPSEAHLDTKGGKVQIRQTLDVSDSGRNFTRSDERTRFVVELSVESDSQEAWTLSIRQPVWALETGELLVDGETVDATVNDLGFLEITRVWSHSKVRVAFSKRIEREALPGDESRFALLDGPVVLAALDEGEPVLSADASIQPKYEHVYLSGRQWQSGHYLVDTQEGRVSLVPIYEIEDERYSVYFVDGED